MIDVLFIVGSAGGSRRVLTFDVTETGIRFTDAVVEDDTAAFN